MADKFRIYSTEVTATLTPDSSGAITLIIFDRDPFYGKYESVAANEDRGSVFKTLSGKVIQDFGVLEADEIINFSDTDALGATVVGQLEVSSAVVDEQFYFTDGYNCWLVQFSRQPRGFKSMRNILLSYHGTHVFSYEINLIVISKEI